jgi:hypothetical protein
VRFSTEEQVEVKKKIGTDGIYVEARSAGSVQLAFSYPRFTASTPPYHYHYHHSFFPIESLLVLLLVQRVAMVTHDHITIDYTPKRRRRSLIGRFGGQRARPPSPLRATHRGHVPF